MKLKRNLLLKFRQLGDNVHFVELIKGSSITFFLRIISLISGYIFTYFLASQYGSRAIGIYNLMLSIVLLSSIIPKLGFHTSTVRFISQSIVEGNGYLVDLINKKVLKIIIPINLIVSVLIFVLSDFIGTNFYKEKIIGSALKIGAVTIPLSAILAVNIASLRGLKKIKLAYSLNYLNTITNLFLLFILTLIFNKNDILPVYSYSIAMLILTLISIYLWKRESKKLISSYKGIVDYLEPKTYSYHNLVKTSIPMMVTTVMLTVMGWTDTVMIGIFLNSSEVGIYRVALKISVLTSFFLEIINSIAAPKFSELYWGKKFKELKKLAKLGSKLIFLLSMPIFIIIIVFSKSILNFFGNEFSKAEVVLWILAVAQFINAYCGSVGLLLDMTGNQKVTQFAMSISAISNVILNFVLIQMYGIIGAAIATGVSIVIWNAISVVGLYKKMNFWINYIPFYSK